MFQYRDFVNDPNTFSYENAVGFFDKLDSAYQHYVPIVDSALYIPNPNNASDNYSIYTDGHDRDVFLLNPDGSEYIGSVWPGYTVFPDWDTEEAVPWWSDSMVDWHKKVAFSGIWIDMSEVSSFCVGSCGSGNLSLNPVHPPFGLPGEPGNLVLTYPEGFNLTNATEAAAASSSSASQASSVASATPPSTATTPYFTPQVTPGERSIVNPPYVINNVNGALGVHAVSPNATHHNGLLEYDVHNLFGTQILNATYQALLNVFPGKRPFIIGRSTFAGSGVHAGHWGGDNTSLFAYMYFSIAQALNFGLFGIPMFGVDTCGFNGNSDEELCNRWMQVSDLCLRPVASHDILTNLRAALRLLSLLPQPQHPLSQQPGSLRLVLRHRSLQDRNEDPILTTALHVHPFLLRPHNRHNRNAGSELGVPQRPLPRQ